MLHQMCDVACDLIAKFLAGNNGDFLAHPLVGVKVIAQVCVVLLSDDPGRFLYGFGANAAHIGGSLVKERDSSRGIQTAGSGMPLFIPALP